MITPNRLVTAASTSFIGDGLRLTAVPLLAASITTDPILVAGVIVVERIPWLLIAPYTASLADRKDRLRLAAIAQTIRLLLAAVFALLLSLNLSGIVLLYLFVFVITALETAYDSAVFALVPQVVPDQDLEKVNGRLQAAQTVSLQFAGPPAAALLFRIAPALAFWANSITFAISALILHRRQPKVSAD